MDSIGAPYREKRDANEAAKLQDTTQIKVPTPHSHSISTPTAAEQQPTHAFLWWVLLSTCTRVIWPGMRGESRHLADCWGIDNMQRTYCTREKRNCHL